VSANVRYWPTVAPVVRRELARWEDPAAAIPDNTLRELAIDKLRFEGFNAEVAATLAVLAPRSVRPEAIRAIVSLEVLFDYLDGRTELPSGDPISESTSLCGAFSSAFATDGQDQLPPNTQDGAYVRALSARVKESWLTLPSAPEVAATVQRSAERCTQAQTQVHAAATLGDDTMEEWARERSLGSGLGWREYLSGSASSVLAVHAVIAAAADPMTTGAQAERIDAAYLAIGGVVTILDSLVDRREDLARDGPGLIRLFKTTDELADRLGSLTRLARLRAAEAPSGAHHVMTLAGVAAYYMTHPGAQDPLARTVLAKVRKELSPIIWPTLTVMGTWRKAKGIRAVLDRSR
jgi:hypothetical protein